MKKRGDKGLLLIVVLDVLPFFLFLSLFSPISSARLLSSAPSIVRNIPESPRNQLQVRLCVPQCCAVKSASLAPVPTYAPVACTKVGTKKSENFWWQNRE